MLTWLAEIAPLDAEHCFHCGALEEDDDTEEKGNHGTGEAGGEAAESAAR